MILAIDVGNTAIHFGRFEQGKLKRRVVIRTDPAMSAGALARRLEPVARGAEQIIICSVVPRMTSVLVRAFRSVSSARVRVIGKDLHVPLKNRYRYPKQVGQDRLVGAYAALKRFKQDCIVCDFGTAITIDVVKAGREAHSGRRSSQSAIRNPQSAIELFGEYLGGVIVPGLEISLDALASRTALLPKVALRKPPELLGRDTANSIRAGLVYGYAALCDGLVTELKRRYAPHAAVVATGGGSRFMASHTRTLTTLRPNLVLEGIHLIYQNMR